MNKDAFVVEEINDRDREQWNKIVLEAKEGTFFHSFEWSEVLGRYGKETSAYSPKHVIVTDREENRVVGVLPIFLDKARCLVSLPSGDYGGPCIDPKIDEFEVLKLLFSKLEEIAKREAQEIRLKSLPERYFDWLRTFKFTINPFMYTFLLSIEGLSIDDIYNNFRRDTKRGIRTAEKEGLTVEIAQKKEELQEYYKIYEATMKRLEASIRPYKFFEILWDTLAEKELLKVFMTKIQDKYVAGLICFPWKGTTHIYGNVSLPNYLKQRPNDILYFSAIKWCVEKNFRTVDFGLSPLNMQSGLHQFKERWGTTRKLLYLTSKKYGLVSRVRKTILGH